MRIRGRAGARPIDTLTERLGAISDRDLEPRADLLENWLSRDG
jgi:hypothetical protein